MRQLIGLYKTGMWEGVRTVYFLNGWEPEDLGRRFLTGTMNRTDRKEGFTLAV